MKTIQVSAPAKVHIMGEHSVVYGKPAILAAIGLRIRVTLTPHVIASTFDKLSVNSAKQSQRDRHGRLWRPRDDDMQNLRSIIEKIVKKEFRIKKIPSYEIEIKSEIPVGCGLGSSAAVSAAYIGALLLFLDKPWGLNLINKLTYEAEKVFHGNPSGADSTTVIFGGLIWFRKETPDLKLIQQLPFSISQKISKNFVLINTGKPKETTKEMVTMVKNLYQKKPRLIDSFLRKQEQLTKELLEILSLKNEKKLTSLLKMGENNLESIGVVSKSVLEIIREIESCGGAAKICGGGGKKGPTGVLLCYHPIPQRLIDVAKKNNLDYFKTTLGVEGVRREV